MEEWIDHGCSVVLVWQQAKDVDICGVEIIAGATAVHEHPFTRSTCFVLGNEVGFSCDWIRIDFLAWLDLATGFRYVM